MNPSYFSVILRDQLRKEQPAGLPVGEWVKGCADTARLAEKELKKHFKSQGGNNGKGMD